MLKTYSFPTLFLILLLCYGCSPDQAKVHIEKGDHLILLGGNLCSRMMHYGQFETDLQLRYPEAELYVRNLCDGGDTPGYRPRSGRKSPWAFPGAESYFPDGERFFSRGHLETPDEWITRNEADVIIAFFGSSESFNGADGLANFRAELDAFVNHTLAQKYNGLSAPKLVLVSPTAFEDLSDQHDLPDGKKENANLELYTNVIQEVAHQHQLPYVDLFHPSEQWFAGEEALTIDGLQLTEAAYEKVGKLLAEEILGGRISTSMEKRRQLVNEAVNDKNWFWHNDFKIPNGVHAYGTRYEPFGPDNYPAEFSKIREMTAIRDRAIWRALAGEKMDVAAADRNTSLLPEVKTNYDTKGKDMRYKYGEEALKTLKVPAGYKVELFASEETFPELANPAQLSFDNQGRLWVATLESYPHYKPGAERPNDKLIILEDTDKDGKADKSTIWADGLSLPIGFEFAPEGVYVSQSPNLVLLTDTDGDDRADKKEIVLSGFDDHDTHHAISAFCADPSGAIYMGEGIFLHSNVETAYGTERATWGGFFRYNPQRRKLERTAQIGIPNPWGIAFDDWGQPFFAETSGPAVRWMSPSTIKARYGENGPMDATLIEEDHRVRPTSGLEFVSSSHFPPEVQGDLVLANAIGFLGMKQHQMLDKAPGYDSRFRQDLVSGSDPNFRPVDMEFAPDGSLYFLDWHNVLIGHMQHNARDPLRDHVHGRVYRITYPGRPLVEPAKVAGASIPELLDNLKLPEYRSRYRSRRELRGRDKDEVYAAIEHWLTELDPEDPRYEHQQLEALWVSWGINRINQKLLAELIQTRDFRARTAATRVLRYVHHQVKNAPQLFLQAANDAHPRVRTEAMTAASWLPPEQGQPIMDAVLNHPLEGDMLDWQRYANAYMKGDSIKKDEIVLHPSHLEGPAYGSFMRGQEIYKRDGFCSTCHQMTGKGLSASGFPPLAGTRWVNGSSERLIKLTLNGLYGPIKVLDKEYPGQVPMTPYGGMLNDQEIADVLTFVRNAFDNRSSVILPEAVKRVRAATKSKSGFYSPQELLEAHPFNAQEEEETSK